MYDIAKIFEETKESNNLDDCFGKRNCVLADVLICFQTKDFKEEDFGKLCKIMGNCVSNRFVFEKDGSDKEFLPYYVFLPWLKENFFDCKEIIGKHRFAFLFDKLQILAGHYFAFDKTTVEYILQSLQKLFEQQQLINHRDNDYEKRKFCSFILHLFHNSSDKTCNSLYCKYLDTDCYKYLNENKKWIITMVRVNLQTYYSGFFADREKLFRRKTEQCVAEEGISEPTRVRELKTIGQDELSIFIHKLEHDDNAGHLYWSWITYNVIQIKKKGNLWVDNGDGTCSNLLEEVDYMDIKNFFDKINFEKDKLEDEKEFFENVLDFMHHLMFEIFSVNDSDVGIYFQKKNVNFNSFFMYCQREDPKSYDKNDKRCGMYGKFLNNEPSGYLAKILGAIPKKLLADKVIKQKIKEIADDSLKAFDELDAEKCGLIFPYLFLKIYLYKKYDLAASNQDKQILFNELKEELNSIKNGLRKSNWPRNIIFEKQILYDMSEYFQDAVDKKEIADVVRSAIIYCHVQDFSEDDFRWYSDNFETDVKNKTEIKVDEDGQPLKNLFLDEIDSIGYYKLKFIVDSNFIIFDKSRLNDEKFKPFSSEEFDVILKKISNEIMFIHSYVKDGMFCVLCHMLKNMTKDKFSDTVKILFDIIDTSTTVVGVLSCRYTVKAVEYIDYLYGKYMCKEGKYRPDLKGCLHEIHDESRSEYRKYKEELEKKRKEDLEKKRIEEGKKNEKNKKYKKEKVKEDNSGSESGESDEGKKKNKRKDIKEKEKNQTKRKQRHKEESISDSEEKSKSDEKKRQKAKGKKSYEEEESESQSSESEDNKKKKYKSTVKRKNNYKSDNSSDEEENDEKEKNKKRKTKRNKHKQRKEESNSYLEEESESQSSESKTTKRKKYKSNGKRKNNYKSDSSSDETENVNSKKMQQSDSSQYEEEESESQSSESEEEKNKTITAKSKLILKKKDESENRSYDEENRAKQKTLKTGVLAKAERNKLNLSKENESIEKSESSNTDKKDYSGSIKYNVVALGSQNKNKNDNDNEIIALSCDGKIKINTEQDNSSNANNDAKIQTNETRISNKNAYDQTKENPPSSQDNKNKKLKWTFGIIGTVLFILAFILFFTLALSLAVKIIISLAILIFSVVCFAIVYKRHILEPPQNLNNGNIVNSEQSFLNDRQKKNEKGQNRASDKINQENKTEYGNLVEIK